MILAIPAAAPATPPKPKIAAMTAIIINVIVQRNIMFVFLINKKFYINSVFAVSCYKGTQLYRWSFDCIKQEVNSNSESVVIRPKYQ